MLAVEGEQRLLVRRQAEEVGLLLEQLDGVPLVRAFPVHELRLGEEHLAPGAVPPLVRPLVNVALGLHARDQRVDPGVVARLRRPDEVVVGDLELPPQLVVAAYDLVRERLGLDAARAGAALHLLAVLVGAGEEADVEPAHPLVAGDRVGDHRGVDVADVRQVVDVVDRRRDVERFACHGCSPAPQKREDSTAGVARFYIPNRLGGTGPHGTTPAPREPSCPRTRASRGCGRQAHDWTPASAGMTTRHRGRGKSRLHARRHRVLVVPRARTADHVFRCPVPGPRTPAFVSGRPDAPATSAA